jgi:hypothetical protein
MKEYFTAEEFIPQHIFKKEGEASIAYMNPKIIGVANKLRHLTGTPLSCNTWKWGGNRNWSGLRDVTSPYYSATSQHSLGNAIDLVSERPAHELRAFILENPDEFPDVTFLECGISWVHIDVRPGSSVKLWVPKRGFISREEFYTEKL